MYSESFLQEILSNLNPSLERFFETYKKDIGLANFTWKEYVSTVLEDNFKNYRRSEQLNSVISVIARKRRNYRHNLEDRYMNLLNGDIEEAKHPFHYILNLPKKEYESLYGEKTLEDIKEDIIRECKEWKENKKYILVDFPGIDCLSKTIKFNVLELDVCFSFWDYVDATYHGNLNYRSIKRVFTNIPLISDKSFKEEFTVDENSNALSVIEEAGGQISLKLTTSNIFVNDLKSLDPRAIVVLSILINNITDMNEFATTRTVVVPLSSIAEEMVDYTYGKKVIKAIDQMLNYMHVVSFEYFNQLNMIFPIRIHIIEELSTYKKGDDIIYKIKFSERYAAEITGEGMLAVSRFEYRRLEDENARTLCHPLKEKQRMVCEKMVDRTEKYDYLFFADKIRFKTGNRKTNYKLITDALSDMVDKKVVVESYYIDKRDNGIVITYLPIDDDCLEE